MRSGKALALRSLIDPDMVPYFDLYRRVTSKCTHGFLFPGGYGDQPAIAIQVCEHIESETAALEQRRMKPATKNP